MTTKKPKTTELPEPQRLEDLVPEGFTRGDDGELVAVDPHPTAQD